MLSVFETIGRSDPWKALALLRDEKFEGFQREGIRSIFSAYAMGEASTFSGLMDGIKNLNTADQNQALVAVLASGGIRPSLLQFVDIIELGANERVVGSAFASASLQMLATEDVESYLKAVADLPIPDEGKRDVIEACLEKLERSQSLEESIAVLQKSALGKDQKTIAIVLTTKWPIAEGRRFASSLEDSNPQKGPALRFVASESVRRDANDAARWISTLPLGKSRDEALQPLLTYFRNHNESDSLDQWSQLLSTPKK